jgi:hypothetical protein
LFLRLEERKSKLHWEGRDREGEDERKLTIDNERIVNILTHGYFMIASKK